MSPCPKCAAPGEHLAILLPFDLASREPVTVLHRCPAPACPQGLWQEPVRDHRAIAIRASAALGRFIRTSGLVCVGTIRPGAVVHPLADEHAMGTRVEALPAEGGGLEQAKPVPSSSREPVPTRQGPESVIDEDRNADLEGPAATVRSSAKSKPARSRPGPAWLPETAPCSSNGHSWTCYTQSDGWKECGWPEVLA